MFISELQAIHTPALIFTLFTRGGLLLAPDRPEEATGSPADHHHSLPGHGRNRALYKVPGNPALEIIGSVMSVKNRAGVRV